MTTTKLLAACPRCNGASEVGCGVCRGLAGDECTACEGRGTKPCEHCDGSGEVDVSAHVVTALVCARCEERFEAARPDLSTAKRQEWLDEHARCGAGT